MNALAKARLSIARWIAPEAAKRVVHAGQQRMYASAKQSRLTNSWSAPDDSADSQLISSLRTLRGRSRALVRDASYAKRAKVVVVNNVVGTGIGMQAQVKNRNGKLITAINDAIEAEWIEWCKAENCHTGGRLHFNDLERQLMGQVFEGGEIFVRQHRRPFGRSRIPLALEIVEPERLAEEYSQVHPAGYVIKMGIEQDEFGRPLGYWMRKLHPAEVRQRPEAQSSDYLYRVSADDIFHLAAVDRWPQTRGEPWLHAVARRLNDMDGYSEAEIVAARGAASYMGMITSEQDSDSVLPPEDPNNPTEQQQMELEPGLVQELPAGKKFEFVAPNRPNPNMDPFLRLMLREVAAGSGVSYESISRDHSQSNFSSSRMGQQDDRDNWQVLQQWFIRSFREKLHHEWMMAAVMANAIPGIDLIDYANNMTKYEAVLFKPRGWAYINPKEDVAASKDAIRGGLSTRSHEIAKYGDGRDREDVDSVREQELKEAKDKGLIFDTDPEMFDGRGVLQGAAAAPAPADPAMTDTGNPATQSDGRIIPMRTTHA